MCIFYESLFEIESNGFWGESFGYFFFRFLLARKKSGTIQASLVLSEFNRRNKVKIFREDSLDLLWTKKRENESKMARV